MSKNLIIGFVILVFIFSFSAGAFAQTSAFVYQGKLQDGGTAANGTYQFEFKLFDAAAGGNQIGSTISNIPATVTGGIFAVNLDFGAANFDGTARFLEIAVRLNGSNQPFTLLNPRQPVTSTPYAVRSLNANQATTANNSLNLGGVPANQYVLTTDPRMSDDRDPLPDSPNYIQNTQNQQASSNFNISGEGKAVKLTAVVVNATSSFQQGGGRVLHFNNTKSGFVGLFTGTNTTGSSNMFVGYEAGSQTTSGSFNSFLGSESGKENLTGFNNSFFGAYSGRANTTGGNNAFFGANSGLANNASFNSFFGSNSGFANTSGTGNSFFGASAGLKNESGLNNSFYGRSAGEEVVIATNNSFFGAFAGWKTTAGGNSFFGANAGEKTSSGFSNSFFGLRAGQNNLTGSRNVFIGFEAGNDFTSGTDNIFIGAQSGDGVTGGSGNIRIGKGDFCNPCNNNIAIGTGAFVSSNVTNSIAIGKGVSVLDANQVQIGNEDTETTRLKGIVRIDQPPVSVEQREELCWEYFTNKIVRCNANRTPSAQNSTGDLNLVKRLDEQNEQIKKQDEQIKAQQTQIDALKALVCQSNPTAQVCGK
jgi:hypothetical protein